VIFAFEQLLRRPPREYKAEDLEVTRRLLASSQARLAALEAQERTQVSGAGPSAEELAKLPPGEPLTP
jgi:hypothetical protein